MAPSDSCILFYISRAGKLGLPIERREHFDAENPSPPTRTKRKFAAVVEGLPTVPTMVPVMVPVTMKVIVSVAIVVTVPIMTAGVVVRRVIAWSVRERFDDGNTREANTHTDGRMRFGGHALSNAGDSQSSA
jgi:hypothetical protein